MYAIDNNIPPPANKMGRPAVYPLRNLEVGQSFFVPLGDRKTISVCASRYAKASGKTFTVRQVQGGVRCWRTA